MQAKPTVIVGKICSLAGGFAFSLFFFAFMQTASAFTKSGTVYTTDGSQADVMAAEADASVGDEIDVPAGTFSWGAGFVAVNLNKSETLKGAGQGQTIINLVNGGPNNVYGAIQFYSAARVTGMTINGYGQGYNAVPFAAQSGSGWRIDHVTYDATDGGGDDDAGYFIYVNGVYGLIDDCNITGGAGNNELIFARGPTDSWQTPDSYGTTNALYVEDCTFGGEGSVCDINANGRAVLRFNTITSQMKIDGHGYDSNTPKRSVREMEVYDNVWTNGGAECVNLRGGTGILFNNTILTASPSAAWFFLNSYAVQEPWGNYGQSCTISAGNPATVTTPLAHGFTNGFSVYVNGNSTPALANWFIVTVTGANTFTIATNITSGGTGTATRELTAWDYPLPDQIGIGEDPPVAHSDPVYLWNNTAQGGVDWTLSFCPVDTNAIITYRVQSGNPAATFTISNNIIKADRDYFKQTVGTTFNGSTGVGVGTTAQMNAITPSKTGVGFWVTDQGNWNTEETTTNSSGELYVWNGSAWVSKYEPLTYPYPGTGSSEDGGAEGNGGGSGITNSTPQMSPPSNLRPAN
ncbi:MAG TPA: hypothetical protein VMD27_11280 [Candidatus Aquilonibacter sp.]|nr:hypothetical protein [Candidatus Aquilonibacter sp.]